MVEIHEAERIKEMRTTSETFGTMLNASNIQIIGVPEEDKMKGHENIFEEIIVESFPIMGKEIATQVQEIKQDKPNVKLPKTHINQINKDQTQITNIKSSKEKQQITHKGIPIRIAADLSIESLQARREWQDILTVMKENNLQPRLLYPERISFKYEGEIKSFTDKQKLREFSSTKLFLQQMLKDLL